MSVKITPADEKIEFLDNAGNLDAKISLDGSGNLKLENFNGGSMVLGDPTADIYVGDGSASVDIVYDVGGRLYSTANQHLTIGKSSLGGNDIVIDSPNWSVSDTGLLNLVADGTAGTAIQFGGNASTYIYSSSSGLDLTIRADDDLIIRADDDLSLQAGGATVMRIDSTGNVGIGTSSPSMTSGIGLEVSHGTQANLRVTDSSASASSDFAQSENDLYIVNRKSGGNIRMRVGGSTETILMDSDGDIKFANGATSSWATWNSVVFSRHSYGTTSGSGAGLYVSDNGTNTIGGHNIPFTAKIRAVAFHFGGSSVDFTSTSNNSWNIFRAGQTSDSFATVTFNNGQGTRLQSGGSDTNHMYYVVTGLNISVAAGDTIHLRRESGTTNVGNVRIEIFYSHV